MGKAKVQKKAVDIQHNQNKRKKQYRVIIVRVEDGTYEMVVRRSDGNRRLIGKFLLPCDNQLIKDYATLKNVEEAFKKRCNPKSDSGEIPSKVEDCFYDIYYQQIDFGLFELYLPNGILIAVVATPCNMQYGKDILLIKEICRQLAYRYEIR